MPASDACQLKSAIPVLPSLDFERTTTFFHALGFKTLFHFREYMGISRDSVEIHFWLTDNPLFPQNSSCRIEVTGIETLYAAFHKLGVIRFGGELATQPWGFREFVLNDPDGNCYRIAEPV